MSRISVPIDASQVPANERESQRIRVAVQSGSEIVSQVISLNSGNATANVDIEGSGPVTIAVGPESSSAASLFNRATPTLTVRPDEAGGKQAYTVRPIVISLPIWREWLIWCRHFTISGYVLGLDGNPVPSAQVSAYNVDWFWWWSSTGQVGATATTDPTGFFTIDFEWCCGWLPWYWWGLRQWRLDPVLVEKIQSVLQLNPNLSVSAPSPALKLNINELNPQPLPPSPPTGQSVVRRTSVSTAELNPSNLPALRENMLKLLPTVPEFERFCLWPWCAWWPWLDCDPNIIFRVTQSCGGLSQVIVSENVWQARVDIPTNLSVTLTANANACTIPPQGGDPEGICFLFTGCCGEQAMDIGLTGAPLAGLADPGSEDRPFTGTISITGQFGYTAADLDYADYYELQYRPEGGSGWLSVPPSALQAFGRTYFDATLAWPNQWSSPTFSPTSMPVSGHPGQFVTVYPSRQFFEIQNPPNNWGDVLSGRSWTYNIDGIAVIETAGFFVDGAYEFQVIGYTFESDGTVSSNGVLPGCGKPSTGGINDNNDFSLFFANPSSTDAEPDAQILNVWFNGSLLPPCGIVTLPSGEPFSFGAQFTASDAEGYLDYYTLQLQWGTNAPASFFSCGCLPGCGLSAGAGVEIGPCYADAISQGAARPNWSGGTMTLTIPDASTWFPQSCAYDLILTVYKRNIIDCDPGAAYYETAYYSFTVLFA